MRAWLVLVLEARTRRDLERRRHRRHGQCVRAVVAAVVAAEVAGPLAR